MNIKVYYEEVANYVEKHYMIRPQLRRIDDKSIEVSCRLGHFIPPMAIQIRIEAMRKDVVCMSYECGTGMAMLIAGAVKHLDNKLPHGVEIKPEDKRINFFPNQVKEIRKIMEYAQLDGIHIHEDGLELLVSLTKT